MIFTVIGGAGFIGRHMDERLRQGGFEVRTCIRGRSPKTNESLGHVIYAAGVTGDFLQRTDDLLDAHVVQLRRVLADCTFDSLVYLSSTRLYGTNAGSATTTEESPVSVIPSADAVYNISKLLGEGLCLSDPRPSVRIARLSHVYGIGQRDTTFLGLLLRDLSTKRVVELRENPRSARDYVSVHDVADLLPKIAMHGQLRIYNVASGTSLEHSALADLIKRQTGRQLLFSPGAPTRISPMIDISRIRREFDFAPRSLMDDMPGMLAGCGVMPLTTA